MDTHAQCTTCGHDHGHDHEPSLALGARWGLSVLIIAVSLVFLRPFIVNQMLVRVTSYSANSSYSDAIRLCKKIITIDKDNIRAWTSLGYAYMDMSEADEAIAVFKNVFVLNPDNRGAASFELGQAYFAKGDFAKAIEYLERVRSVGPRAAALLDADILKYRHGTLGFRSLNSMQTLLQFLAESYKKTGNIAKAAEIQKEYEYYRNKHNKVLF
jgi:tetratricopeptide (TPR) repeat protein